METVADLPWISNVNDHPEILDIFVRKEQMMIHVNGAVFQVDGAVSITFNQVQGMLNDLKNTLTTALSTAVANQHNSNASNHLTNNSDVQCNTDARQEVKDIPGVAFREIPMYSLNHLREEFLQLFKHLQMSGRLRKFNSHRQSRLTPEGLIAPHK